MPPPEPEVQNGLALVELGYGGGVAAAQAGQQGGVGELVAIQGGVELGAEPGLLGGRGTAAAAAVAAAVGRLPTPTVALAGGHLGGGGGVAGPDLLAEGVLVGLLRWSSTGSLEVEGGGQAAKGVRSQRVVGPDPALLAVQQPGGDELLEVVADGRLAEPERPGELAHADRVGTGGQEVEDLDAVGVGQGLEQPTRSPRPRRPSATALPTARSRRLPWGSGQLRWRWPSNRSSRIDERRSEDAACIDICQSKVV